MERIEIRPGYTISRVIKGGWHLAGGHGNISEEDAIVDMRRFVAAGITTFDCADIYTGVEELIGAFLKKYKVDFSTGDLPAVQIHTKYVPDYAALAKLTKKDTEGIIDRSLLRLGVEQLDLVQFAWWDVTIPGWIETAIHLQELQEKGKIRYIGLTNFNTEQVRAIIKAGVQIVSNQVQYSVLDNRPTRSMVALAEEHDFHLLCYGVLAGGFLTDQYYKKPFPDPPFENRSLTKYALIIEEFGGIELYHAMLDTLKLLADKYKATIAQVACAYILQKYRVGAVIVGARNSRHLSAYARLKDLLLSDADCRLIRNVQKNARGPGGTVYELERDKNGKHGAIMKYNLNEQ